MVDNRKKRQCRYYAQGYCMKTEEQCPFGHFEIDETHSRDSSSSSSSESRSPRVRFRSTYRVPEKSSSYDSREDHRSNSPEYRNNELGSQLPSTSRVRDYSPSSTESSRRSPLIRPVDQRIICNRWSLNTRTGYRVSLRTIKKKVCPANKFEENKSVDGSFKNNKFSDYNDKKEPHANKRRRRSRSKSKFKKSIKSDYKLKGSASFSLLGPPPKSNKSDYELEGSASFSLLGPASKSMRESFESWLWQKEINLYCIYLPDKSRREMFTIFEKDLLPHDAPFDLVPTDFDLVAFNNSVFKKIKEWSKLESFEQDDYSDEVESTNKDETVTVNNEMNQENAKIDDKQTN